MAPGEAEPATLRDLIAFRRELADLIAHLAESNAAAAAAASLEASRRMDTIDNRIGSHERWHQRQSSHAAETAPTRLANVVVAVAAAAALVINIVALFTSHMVK